jgi:RNA polymerase sigma-70 factor (ECF subfamily)
MSPAEPAAAVLSDAAIIQGSLREPERFGGLFDRHAPYVYRYLARRLGNQAAADLVAETFLAAFRRRHRYDTTRQDALPWLYGIATKLVGQHRREEARELRLRRSLVPEPNEDFPADRVADRVLADRMRRPLLDALAGLAPADRDVLLLVAAEQLTYHEVAIALEIPVGTVRSRLHRARRAVRAALRAEPIYAEEPRP